MLNIILRSSYFLPENFLDILMILIQIRKSIFCMEKQSKHYISMRMISLHIMGFDLILMDYIQLFASITLVNLKEM